MDCCAIAIRLSHLSNCLKCSGHDICHNIIIVNGFIHGLDKKTYSVIINYLMLCYGDVNVFIHDVLIYLFINLSTLSPAQCNLVMPNRGLKHYFCDDMLVIFPRKALRKITSTQSHLEIVSGMLMV